MKSTRTAEEALLLDNEIDFVSIVRRLQGPPKGRNNTMNELITFITTCSTQILEIKLVDCRITASELAQINKAKDTKNAVHESNLKITVSVTPPLSDAQLAAMMEAQKNKAKAQNAKDNKKASDNINNRCKDIFPDAFLPRAKTVDKLALENQLRMLSHDKNNKVFK